MCENIKSDFLGRRNNDLLINYFLSVFCNTEVLFLNWKNKINLATLKNKMPAGEM